MKNIRLKIAALIAGGKLCNIEGRTRAGRWYEGAIITTRKGEEAMKAAFWDGAIVTRDTALTDYRK